VRIMFPTRARAGGERSLSDGVLHL
jgi:hypothetical protein